MTVPYASNGHDTEKKMMMTCRLAAIITVLLFGVSACADNVDPPVAGDNIPRVPADTDNHGSTGSAVAADCQSQVRVDEVVYTSYTFTRREATRHSSAEASDCDDTGPDASGSVFPAGPDLVETWTFADYPPQEVLGVKYDESGSYAVFVADSLPRTDREAIYDDFAQ